MAQAKRSVTVKFMYRSSYAGSHEQWLRQFPGGDPRWGRCRFVFDPDARVYDWLVVYHDLPPHRGGSDGALTVEAPPRDRRRTMLVTYEPATVTTYGRRYLRQYGFVLSSQEPEFIAHPGLIHSQTGFPWHHGRRAAGMRTFDEFVASGPPHKRALLSTVCSSKRQRHTLNAARFEFTRRLKSDLPQLEVFGHGVRDIDDKALALDPFKYHLAIENHRAAHHWTEKLADAYLGYCLPFYAGCPDAADYFPAESFIAIDIRDYDTALATIRAAIRDNEYEKRLGAIVEARRRVLYEYNLFAVLAREIERLEEGALPASSVEPGVILCRRAFHTRHPVSGLGYLAEKTTRRLRATLRGLRGS